MPPALIVSPSATSLAVKSGSGASVSSVACGTTFGTYNIPALAGGGNFTATGGYAVITGLLPSTTYYVQATVSGVTQTATTTTTALAASTPIISLTIGSATQPVNNQITADTFYSAVSNDGVQYITSDDTSAGWAGSGSRSALALGKFTSESPYTGADVNVMTSYGLNGAHNGTDGYSPKTSGLYALDGNLFMAIGRQNNAAVTSSPLFGIYPQTAGNIILSKDHGATWANFQAPTVFNANGNMATPPTAFWFPLTTQFSTLTFAMYGPDDGTLGYRVDNADGYVYIATAGQSWDNGDNVYLARVPRALMVNLNYGDLTFYTGGDGTLDANWSSNVASATAILSSAGKLGYTSISYIPSLNRYLQWQWHYGNATVTSSTVWETYEGPHPWGPWTKIDTTSWSPQGFYNPVPLQRTLAGVTANGTPLTLAFSGDYLNPGPYYHFFTADVVVNTH